MSTQSGFRAGLLNPNAPAPAGLENASAGPPGKRYDVYRNNVTHALIEALSTAFPLVHNLIGPQQFAQIAPQFVRSHPPSSPLMMFYGVEFPEFLESAPVLSEIGYLSDTARLDLALRQAYHAADATALTAAHIQDMAPETLMSTKFTLAPATQILRSDWPLYDIWRYALQDGAPKPRAIAQDVLITRPAFDPIPHLLPQGGAVWFNALASHQSFGKAHEIAIDHQPDFDLQATLTLALSSGALVDPSTRT